MHGLLTTEVLDGAQTLELVPRLKGQGYAAEHVGRRRAWVEEKTGETRFSSAWMRAVAPPARASAAIPRS